MATIFRNILDQLGIDYKKEAEVYATPLSENKILYSGWYHACGRILKGEQVPVPSLGKIQEVKYIALSKESGILIREAHELAGPSFPKPILQLEFNVDVEIS